MRTELGLALFFLVGLVFKFLHLPGAGIITVLSLQILALVYAFGGAYFFKDSKTSASNLALSVISGICLAIAVTGILFKLQYWPGAVILLVGMIASIAALVATLVAKSKAEEEMHTYYKHMTIRTVVVASLTTLLYFTPNQALISAQHWDDPERARLKTQCINNPENEEYQLVYDQYLQRLDSARHEENAFR